MDKKARRKTRVADPENWKQTVRKRLRQSGQAYVSTTGKVMAGRRVRASCGECRFKCTKNISEEDRKNIHGMFWRLTDDQKNLFYWKYTSRVTPKKRRRSISEMQTPPKKAFTFQYRFDVKSELRQVCSKFFYNTLDINSKRIYYFYEHCYDEETCMPRSVQRGKNPKPPLPKLEERLDVIRKQISLFAFKSKDAEGENPQKLHLPADLKVSQMYKLYMETTPEEELLKPHWYYKILKEEFVFSEGKDMKIEFVRDRGEDYLDAILPDDAAEQDLSDDQTLEILNEIDDEDEMDLDSKDTLIEVMNDNQEIELDSKDTVIEIITIPATSDGIPITATLTLPKQTAQHYKRNSPNANANEYR